MSTSPKSPEQGRKLEWYAAITLGLLAIAAFIIQALTVDKETTSVETALFNCIQFLLTIGFAWFSTRAISRVEFEQSLKRFAISAYRRISDIDKMVTRLDAEVARMIAAAEPREANSLHIVRAIVTDTGQVVRSSSADWADVIGEELLALERIRTLERERDNLQSDQRTTVERVGIEDRLEAINDQIKALQNTLPARLALDSDSDQGYEVYRQHHETTWLLRQHERSRGGLLLTCVTGTIYPSGRARAEVAPGEPLVGAMDDDGALNVFDTQGRGLGRIQNNSPLDYDSFAHTVERCFGMPLSLVFHEDIGPSDNPDGEISGWFTVRVISVPKQPPALE